MAAGFEMLVSKCGEMGGWMDGWMDGSAVLRLGRTAGILGQTATNAATRHVQQTLFLAFDSVDMAGGTVHT
jgi:hypothetical protein